MDLKNKITANVTVVNTDCKKSNNTIQENEHIMQLVRNIKSNGKEQRLAHEVTIND